MKKSIIRMEFSAPIHVGNKSLSDSEYDLKADTVFSALCIESGDISKLVDQVKAGQLKISDAFPYIGDYYYIPKPQIYVEQESEDYKLFKKIKYITYDTIDAYLAGTLYPLYELGRFILGDSDIRTLVCVDKDPFQVGTFSFKKNAGLYIIVQHEDDYIFELFERLQYSGIGGKRSSGLGRFSFKIEPCFEFHDDSPNLILLNSAMAKDSELKKTLENANYLLQKRSGFIHQSRYKKQDFYTFKAGSVFRNKFSGDVFDVGNYKHPVYRYAVPMFMGVKI